LTSDEAAADAVPVRAPLFWIALLTLLLPGCTWALGYPEPAEERGGELCANGLDDDLDGKTDCDDPGCDGPWCTEESAETCGNGRDDDGDGAADELDVRCWPFATVSTTRCASVRGASYVAPFDARSSGWQGEVSLGTDPRPGHAAAPVILSSGNVVRAVSTTLLTGRVDGMQIDAEVGLSGSAEAVLTLVAASDLDRSLQVPFDAARSTDRTLAWSFNRIAGVSLPGRVGLSAGRFDADAVDVGVWTGTEWFQLRLRVSGRVATVELTTTRGNYRVLPIRVPDAWSETEPLVVAFRASTPTGQQALLSQVEITRPALTRCGDAPSELLLDAGDGLLAAAPGASGFCALTANAGDSAGRGLSTYFSPDGITWTRTAEQFGLGTEVAGAGLTWDENAGRYRGYVEIEPPFVRHGAEPAPLCSTLPNPEVFLLEPAGPDPCGAWTLSPTGLSLAGLPYCVEAKSGAYTIDSSGHDLALLAQRPGAPFVVLHARSADGSSGSFSLMTGAPGVPPGAFQDGRTDASLQGSSDGLLLLQNTAEGAYLFAPHGSSWLERATPLLIPSHEDATFDSDAIGRAILLMDPRPPVGPWSGRVLYSAPTRTDSCLDCTVVGAAWLSISRPDALP
jgi:hypothetical protein